MRSLVSYFKYPKKFNSGFDRTKYNALLLIIITHCFFYHTARVYAQTNPIAQELPYSQDFGSGTFTTMPPGMASWTVSSSPKESQSRAEASEPNSNATIATATSAQQAGGCYGYTTNGNGRLYIQTSSNATNGTNQCVTAIVTTGLQNIKVSYNIEMISAQPRTIGVVLQYRIGTIGTWATVDGSVYAHNISDRSNGNTDTFTNLELPANVNDNAVVQLRWATWRGGGTESGNSSGIGIDNIIINATAAEIQEKYYIQSRQSGNWNNLSSWEMSTDATNWIDANFIPSYRTKSIVIQEGHTITIDASETVDQLIVNGTLSYSGNVLNINDGSDVDMIVNGTFEDLGPNNINWLSNATWRMGVNGTLLRTRSTSSNNWRDKYYNGIENIPKTSNWIIRKIDDYYPSLSTTGGMRYPNLIIENNTGTLWETKDGSTFNGLDDYPIVKGDLNIGGSGSGGVSFLNILKNPNAVLVEGDLIVKGNSILRNYGTGFEIQGDLNVEGKIDYETTNGSKLIFSGSNSQTISGNGTINIYDLTINKTENNLTLSKSLVVDHQLSLANKNISIDRNDITLAATAFISGGSSSSYIITSSTGKIKKKLASTGSAFTFPTGDGTYYTPYSATLNSGTLGANAEIGVRVVNSAEPHITGVNYIKRYWIVTTNDITNANADVNYIYNENDIQGNESSFVAARWNDLGLINIGAVNSTTHTATGVAITSIGNFTVAEMCNTSPPHADAGSDIAVCAGSTATLTASGGLSYHWNTGANTANTIVYPNSTTVYTVTVTNGNGCAATDNVTVTVNPHLKRYSITGSGLNCSDGSAVLIVLNGSESGVDYQLLLNGNPIGIPKAGTGGVIYFGGQTPGVYTIRGKNATTLCTDLMIGSVVK